MGSRCRIGVLGLLLALSFVPSRAGAVAFSIGGTVSEVTDLDDRLVHPVSPGDAFSGWFAYDPADYEPCVPDLLPFVCAGNGTGGRLVISLNGLTYMLRPDAESQIGLVNDAPTGSGAEDVFSLYSTDVADDSELGDDREMLLWLEDDSASVLDDLQYPTSLDLTDFSSASLYWRVIDLGRDPRVRVEVAMDIASLALLEEEPPLPPTPPWPDAAESPVPEPASWWLVLSAVAAARAVVRRRSTAARRGPTAGHQGSTAGRRSSSWVQALRGCRWSLQ